MYVLEVETDIKVTLGGRRDIRLHCQCYSTVLTKHQQQKLMKMNKKQQWTMFMNKKKTHTRSNRIV